ncbi:MAG: hypothetical protein ACLFMV_12135 [Spirochaetaceae bacterium]
MLTATKSVLNTLFLLFSAGGFAVVFYNDRLPEDYAFFAPMVLVVAYGLVVSRALRDCHDASLADHHTDSIYFLGFLYTLVSLVVLFYELRAGVSAGAPPTGAPPAEATSPGEAIVSDALYFVGISVSTSLAGVLFRNMARGAYLKSHPDEGDELERTYELLSSTAERFAADSRASFDNLELFLKERAETTKAFEEAEKRYLSSLENFIDTTESFNRGLQSAQAELARRVSELGDTTETYRQGLARLAEMTGDIEDTTGRVISRAGELPLESASAELERLRGGVRELNLVLDSLISILDTKVEKVG